jgi:hypothetical protein
MKTKTFKDMSFNVAVLATVGAIALYAKQASAFGMMGAPASAGISAHTGVIGAGRPGSMGIHGGASNVAGAITVNGITVLPNGTVIVPAVIARTAATKNSNANQLNDTETGPCKTAVCKP